jgi:hypothetical protein
MRILLFIAFAAIVILIMIRERRVELRRAQKSFDAVEFPGSGGLRGRDMRVVKRMTDTVRLQLGGSIVLGAHWYCLGPGPSYYVAIAQRAQSGWLHSRLEWVIRPLSAERMQDALMGDKEALILAFGEEAPND